MLLLLLQPLPLQVAVSGREFFNWDCSACSSGPYLLRRGDVALSQDGGGAISLGLLTLYASVGDLISEPVKYILAREMFYLLSIHSVDSVPQQTHYQYQQHWEEQDRQPCPHGANLC